MKKMMMKKKKYWRWKKINFKKNKNKKFKK